MYIMIFIFDGRDDFQSILNIHLFSPPSKLTFPPISFPCPDIQPNLGPTHNPCPSMQTPHLPLTVDIQVIPKYRSSHLRFDFKPRHITSIFLFAFQGGGAPFTTGGSWDSGECGGTSGAVYF